MILSDVSVKRPVFAAVLSLLIIIGGILSFERLPLREYPDIDPPVVSIVTRYVGASASVVETRVTQVLEDIVSGVEGIETIESKSKDGLSSITVEFGISRDVDSAANDVRDRVNRVLAQLPDEVDPPEITKQDADASEIIWLALQSDTRTGLDLTDYADRYILDRLSIIDGVGRVRIGGERRYAMRVWLDRKAMAARGLTADDVENALRRENIELPAGRVESLAREFTVRVDRVYNRAEDFAALVVARGDNGYLVRLGDIAEVTRGVADDRTELRSNGKASIGLGISKQSKANTLDVARKVKAAMEQIRATLPADIEIMVAYDSSIYIESSVHEVYLTFGLTILLVVAVIWAFLGDLRATLIPALTVPVSLIGAFIVLMALGFSVNLLTLLALVLAIGLVVDDSIVVVENVYKRIEHGEPPLAAAYLGTRQVALAVIATTLVLVAVFLPITFMQGNIGKLFTEFAWAIAGAVLFSGFVALTLTPMLCSKLLRQHPGGGHASNPVARAVNAAIDGFEARYRGMLTACINHPRIVIALMLVLIGLGSGFYMFIPKEYAPSEDRGYFFSVVIAPEGSSFEYTRRAMLQVEKPMLELLDKGEAHRIVTIVPGGFTGSGTVNSGFAIALLKPWEERDRKAQDIVGEMFMNYMGIPGVMAFPISPPGLGLNPRQTPVQFVIGGTSYEDLARWRDLMLERVRMNPKLLNVEWDYKEGKPQMRVRIDRDRAADLGVSVRQIGRTLETMLGSRQVTTYLDRGEEYDVILQGQYGDRLSPTDVNNIYVRSERTGKLIPLSNLITITETADAGELSRFNRLRAITISANLRPDYALGDALRFMQDTAKEVLPPEARTDYKGQSREFLKAGASIYFTFLLALVAVYLFLAAQFESFVHPLIIMTTVPFALIGALWGLYLGNGSINIYTQVGLIMLVGLAAKNGILIVEFANQLRDEGVEFMESIYRAAQTRLRPILMTSVATMAGAVPLIIASGAGAESRFPIGIVVFAGVLFSTVLTLFVVPVFYALLARRTRPPQYVSRLLAGELGDSK